MKQTDFGSIWSNKLLRESARNLTLHKVELTIENLA